MTNKVGRVWPARRSSTSRPQAVHPIQRARHWEAYLRGLIEEEITKLDATDRLSFYHQASTLLRFQGTWKYLFEKHLSGSIPLNGPMNYLNPCNVCRALTAQEGAFNVYSRRPGETPTPTTRAEEADHNQ